MSYPIVTRFVPFGLARADDGATSETTDNSGDGNTLVGLAVPFDVQTRIDNWAEGTFDEQFKRGAFKRSLGLRTPVLQFDHGTHPMLGSIPLGTFDRLEEAERGLEVEAPLFQNWLTEPIRDAIRSGALSGMSIRFRPLKVDIIEAEARDDGGDVELRSIVEAELHELGPVVFPAYPATEVDLRNLDLANESDRHRLAQALLGGGAMTDRVGQPSGPGTAPHEAGAPASGSGQATSHPDCTPRRDPRVLAQRARMHEYV